MALSDYNSLFPEFLEVRRTGEFGRGVYTKRRLLPGTELVRADPVTHVLSSSERGLRCDNCLERKQYLCSGVARASSSDTAPEHVKSDWAQHKAECRGIARISPKIPTDTIRLLARLLTRRASILSQPGDPALPERARWPLDLLGSREDSPGYSDELKTSLAEQVMGAKLLLGEEKEALFDAQVAFEIACKLMSNSFSILDAEMNSIGGGVYIVPALFNHSCDPNCVALFTGVQMQLRCVKQVSDGEQLLVSYVDLLDTRERRHRQLYKYYQFSCQCIRCGREGTESTVDRLLCSTAAELSDAERKQCITEGFQLLDRAEQMKKRGDWTELLKLAEEFLKAHQETLGGMNVVVVKMRECLLDAYTEQARWKDGLEVASVLRLVYEKCYHHYNPLKGIHLFKMAKLMHQVSDQTVDLESSALLLDQAVGILTVTHGHTHPLVEEARGSLRDVQMELTHRK